VEIGEESPPAIQGGKGGMTEPKMASENLNRDKSFQDATKGGKNWGKSFLAK